MHTQREQHERDTVNFNQEFGYRGLIMGNQMKITFFNHRMKRKRSHIQITWAVSSKRDYRNYQLCSLLIRFSFRKIIFVFLLVNV